MRGGNPAPVAGVNTPYIAPPVNVNPGSPAAQVAAWRAGGANHADTVQRLHNGPYTGGGKRTKRTRRTRRSSTRHKRTKRTRRTRRTKRTRRQQYGGTAPPGKIEVPQFPGNAINQNIINKIIYNQAASIANSANDGKVYNLNSTGPTGSALGSGSAVGSGAGSGP